ncbi:MAG: FAD-dependent oxidoreductase [Bacteroidota bacterium]
MTRKEFLKMCSLLGIGLPLQSTLTACNNEDGVLNPSDKVIIIGAGAGGLTAAYLLRQRGIEVQLLEASATYGGRMKRTLDFADFPIPLGAEWLHVERGVFREIINDSSIEPTVETRPYDHQEDVGLFEGVEISTEEIGFSIDQKFIGSSWLGFFEQYVLPSVEEFIFYNKVVESIDYSADEVVVHTAAEIFRADRVILNVPVKQLQLGAISFVPALPTNKQEAIDEVTVWDGCKAFIAFSEKFYPTFVGFDIGSESAGEKLYYDAAYGQNTTENILGLFAVGIGTLPYVNLSDEELIAYMLQELDDIFDGQASANYLRHTFQNWNEEPFINGAYIYDDENWRRVRTLGESVANKLFFAGCAYTQGEDWSSVHTAARSAIRAVRELVG